MQKLLNKKMLGSFEVFEPLAQKGISSGGISIFHESYSLDLVVLPYGHFGSDDCRRQSFYRVERRFIK